MVHETRCSSANNNSNGHPWLGLGLEVENLMDVIVRKSASNVGSVKVCTLGIKLYIFIQMTIL